MDKENFKRIKPMIGIAKIIGAVGNIADDLITTKEEKQKAELEFYKVDASMKKGQMEVNKTEAQHKSIFVAGWRPAVGWICVFGLAYQFLLFPVLTWSWVFAVNMNWIPNDLEIPGPLDAMLIMELLFGMLGLGAYRTYEKKIGIASNHLKR